MIIILRQSAEVAWEAFKPYQQQFRPFRDASYGDCTYSCSIFQCLKGLEIGVSHGWYNFREFDNKEYEYYEKVENGDMNVIIPNKFIAFMGPVDPQNGHRRGNSPEDYLQVFKHFGVSCVVRLNEPKYDKTKFTKAGINHADLFFIDGSVPPDVSQNQIMLTILIYSLL